MKKEKSKPTLPDVPDSIPGCFGYHGFPIAPNGPCNDCPFDRICDHVSKFFISKDKVLADFKRIRDILRGAA